MAEAGTDSYEREKGFQLMNRESDYYKSLTKAHWKELQMVHLEFVSVCGELIPEERMMEVPNATKCVRCKEDQKIKLRLEFMVILSIIFTLVTIDQWTKYFIKTNFSLYQSKPVIENFFHLTYITNDGMAFGLSFPGGKKYY